MNQLQKFVALYCPNIAIITLAIILWRSFLMKWKISIFPFLLQKIIRQLQIFLRTNGYYPSTTECSMVINTDNIVEKPSSFDCSFDFKKTENENEIIFEIF